MSVKFCKVPRIVRCCVSMKIKNIVAFGEIVWDCYPDKKLLGGAPLNFAYYCGKLGANASIISAVGRDFLAEETNAKLSQMPVDKNCVSSNDYQTGVVDVKMLGAIPHYEIKFPSAWDFIELNSFAEDALKKADAFLFGTLAQRNEVSAKTLQRCIELLPATCLKIFDVNFRQNYYSKEILERCLEYTDILKINDEELDKVSEMLDFSGTESERAKNLFEKFNLKILVVTRGGRGQLVLTNGLQFESSAKKVEVVDTVGAGDSFIAGFVSRLLMGDKIFEAVEFASELASKVCQTRGALLKEL